MTVAIEKAERPTLYFIGVTTAQSSIMRLFPKWVEPLGLHNAVIKGIDLKIHDDPQRYREVLKFIKEDPLSYGALITTHKIDFYNSTKDMFDYLDPYATVFEELSCIAKNGRRVEGYAKDPITSGLAMESFIPQNHWLDTRGEVFIMGAGGSAIAIASNLINEDNGRNIPSRIVVSNRSMPRLMNIERILGQLNPQANCEYRLTPELGQNDELLRNLKPHSLVVNATGLGKDRPGSPLTDSCVFPDYGLIWELNYRGDLRFMHQALNQAKDKGLHVEDGWVYFIHGWTQVIAEIFDISISSATFQEICEISQMVRTDT